MSPCKNISLTPHKSLSRIYCSGVNLVVPPYNIRAEIRLMGKIHFGQIHSHLWEVVLVFFPIYLRQSRNTRKLFYYWPILTGLFHLPVNSQYSLEIITCKHKSCPSASYFFPEIVFRCGLLTYFYPTWVARLILWHISAIQFPSALHFHQPDPSISPWRYSQAKDQIMSRGISVTIVTVNRWLSQAVSQSFRFMPGHLSPDLQGER